MSLKSGFYPRAGSDYRKIPRHPLFHITKFLPLPDLDLGLSKVHCELFTALGCDIFPSQPINVPINLFTESNKSQQGSCFAIPGYLFSSYIILSFFQISEISEEIDVLERIDFLVFPRSMILLTGKSICGGRKRANVAVLTKFWHERSFLVTFAPHPIRNGTIFDFEMNNDFTDHGSDQGNS